MRRFVLVGICAALLAAGAAVVLVFLRPHPAADTGLRTLLPALDAAIAAGSLPTAKDLLATVHSIPSAEPDQLRLLKRAYLVGRLSGDFGALASLSARALSQGTRSERIRAIAAYADLRAGRIADARGLLGSSAPGRYGQESMRGEAFVRSGAPWAGSDALTRELVELQESRSPAAFSAAALRTGEKRLALDAALLEMRQGSNDAALGVVRSSLEEARFDEPAGLMLYDGGDFAAAAARLERRNAERPGITAVGLVLADIYAALGKNARSEQLLLATLPSAPTVSWTPYADLALFAALRGDTAGARRKLADGLAFFPRSRELRLMEARVDIAAGSQGEAEAILEGILKDNPSDSEAGLLLLGLRSSTLSPESWRANLWKLFDLAPSDRPVFDTLASSLIAAQDWEGMRIAMKQHMDAGGQPDAQSLIFTGMAAAMRGDDAAATAAFRRAALLEKNGVARFDIALLLLRRGEAPAALAELDGAAGEVEETAPAADRSALLSRIETLRGAARLLDGDVTGAGAALVRARTLDPHNLRAGLLLRKLEAGGQ